MPLPATTPAPVDVLEGHDPQRGVRWSPPHVPSGAWVRLLVGPALVVLVSAVAVGVSQDDSRAGVVDASGSMVLQHHFSEAADRPHSTQMEDKNAFFSGTIQVELPDRHMDGFAQINFSFAATMDDDDLWIFNHSGQVRATFGSATCHGPFAWSFYGEPPVTGGSVNLRCDDGSALAATALVDGDDNGGVGDRYRISLTLQDGWYVAG